MCCGAGKYNPTAKQPSEVPQVKRPVTSGGFSDVRTPSQEPADSSVVTSPAPTIQPQRKGGYNLTN